MNILIDQAILGTSELFGQLGDVRTFQGRSLSPQHLRDADVLIVRSITRVDARLLAGSQVRFVGTTATGVDHIDTRWLAQQGIRFASAPGCNARPVAEYVLCAILILAQRMGIDLTQQTLGVVGVGRIGSQVANWASALGMRVLLDDPPRRRSESPAISPKPKPSGGYHPPPRWVDRDELLASSDFVTLHVPLTHRGPDRTVDLVDSRWLASMRPQAVLINTARGPVICEPDLIAALEHQTLGGAVLDVWAGEPRINARLAALTDIATPHIAGRTRQALQRAAVTVFRRLADWIQPALHDRQVDDIIRAFLDDPSTPRPSSARESILSLNDRDFPHPSELLDVLGPTCDLRTIDGQLKESLGLPSPELAFDRLRAKESARNEWTSHPLDGRHLSPAAIAFLITVGIPVYNA